MHESATLLDEHPPYLRFAFRYRERALCLQWTSGVAAGLGTWYSGHKSPCNHMRYTFSSKNWFQINEACKKGYFYADIWPFLLEARKVQLNDKYHKLRKRKLYFQLFTHQSAYLMQEFRYWICSVPKPLTDLLGHNKESVSTARHDCRCSPFPYSGGKNAKAETEKAPSNTEFFPISTGSKRILWTSWWGINTPHFAAERGWRSVTKYCAILLESVRNTSSRVQPSRLHNSRTPGRPMKRTSFFTPALSILLYSTTDKDAGDRFRPAPAGKKGSIEKSGLAQGSARLCLLMVLWGHVED